MVLYIHADQNIHMEFQKWNLCVSIFLLQLLFQFQCLSLPVDPNDLLKGKGLFHANQTNQYSDPASSHQITIINNEVLKLTKLPTQAISFNNGVQFAINQSQPTHISFEMTSFERDIEDANFRLLNVALNKTILLFRAGKGGFLRVNENQMISNYNQTHQNQSNLTLIKIDLVLDWNHCHIQVFVNGIWKAQTKFLSLNTINVNLLRIYNLYPSSSYWKNLVVCTQRCYQFQSQIYLLYHWFLMIVFFIFFLR